MNANDLEVTIALCLIQLGLVAFIWGIAVGAI